MTKLVISILVALAFVGSAAGQVMLPGTSTSGDGYLGDERNPTAAGSLPYANHPSDNQDTTYDADNTGIPAALGGAATDIVGARFYHRDYVTGDLSATHVDYNYLLGAFGLGDYLITGVNGHFTVFHGNWADLNGDEFITDPEFTGGDVVVDVASGRDCGDAIGRLDTTALTYACQGGDEWAGLPDANIVGYITPYVPIESLPTNTIGAKQTRDPDLVFSGGDNGRYFSPSTNWDLYFIDNSLLETTAVEIYNAPATVTDGPRSQVPSSTSLVDTDIYSSVDPAVEGLYQTGLAFLVANGVDPDHPESPLFPDPGEDVDDATEQFVGPATASIDIAQEHEYDAKFATDYHVYFDIFLTDALDYWPPLIYTAGDDEGDTWNFGAGQASFPLAGIYGWLGVWQDFNGDTWIGNPEVAPGCADEYDCGNDDDPNMYDDQTEFTPRCGPGRNGEILGILSSDTGSWGTGVYVTTDRVDENGNDPYADDGRMAFNPYDDMVLDAADGSVDALRLSGPIQFHLVCDDPQGFYHAYEHFEFLPSDGKYSAISIQASVTADFRDSGVDSIETVADTDTYVPWL